MSTIEQIRQTAANLRAELASPDAKPPTLEEARALAEAGIRLVEENARLTAAGYVPIAPHGETPYTFGGSQSLTACTGCGHWRDDPHTWAECAAELRRKIEWYQAGAKEADEQTERLLRTEVRARTAEDMISAVRDVAENADDNSLRWKIRLALGMPGEPEGGTLPGGDAVIVRRNEE